MAKQHQTRIGTLILQQTFEGLRDCPSRRRVSIQGELVRRIVWGVFAIMSVACVSLVSAGDRQLFQKQFEPPNGTGRVLIVISGQKGPISYAYYAKATAAQGYYTVLVNGNDFWKKGVAGAPLLKDVITRTQQSPHAVPGKVAVIGFSLGGASALTYASRMPDLVSAVVAYYPVTSFITDPGGFVAKIKVPTLMFAGVRDTYKDCCLIATARKMADAAKRSEGRLSVIEYADAGHGWATKYSGEWRGNDADDALRRTLDHLRQNFRR